MYGESGLHVKLQNCGKDDQGKLSMSNQCPASRTSTHRPIGIDRNESLTNLRAPSVLSTNLPLGIGSNHVRGTPLGDME